MINKFTMSALALIFIVISCYVYQFYFLLNLSISDKPEVWGQLGDYIGGLLNPALTFVSIVLLINSLKLQRQANESLLLELDRNKKNEKLRVFENQFFNMVDAQKNAFNSFELNFNFPTVCKKKSFDAVIEIENNIDILKKHSTNFNNDVKKLLISLDGKDQLFGVVRVFYVNVKLISERLSDSNEFTMELRVEYLNTLINFTDFALIRLVLLYMQFMDYACVKHLRNNQELIQTFNSNGLKLDPY